MMNHEIGYILKTLNMSYWHLQSKTIYISLPYWSNPGVNNNVLL